jgi:hypothetical protein
MRGALSVLLAVLLVACGGSASAPPNEQPAAQRATSSRDDALRVSTEIRRSLPKRAACGAGDVCGYFLQVMSPGSDAKDLADKAVRVLRGKCGGHVIVYRDARGVMGSGSVFATAEEKRACERALGRAKEDTDFPHALVWQVAK